MSKSTGIDINKILKLLPHRYPFLLVDRVLEITPRVSITALKNVTMNEPFFQGHFPDFPVMPGVLIIEALAQTARVLAVYRSNRPIGASLSIKHGRIMLRCL